MRTFLSVNPLIHTLAFIALFCVFQVRVAGAVEYTPLVGIPGLDGDEKSLPDYLNAVYKFLIAAGALFGVLKIAFAGVKYSLTDVITEKGSALADIKGVLLGLLLLIMPYVVLNTINSNLINLDVLSGVKSTDLKSPIAGLPTEAVLTPAEHRAHMECIAKEGEIRDDGSCSGTVFTEDGCDAVHMNWSDERNTCEGFDMLGATYRSSDLVDATRFANMDNSTSDYSWSGVALEAGIGAVEGAGVGCAVGIWVAGIGCLIGGAAGAIGGAVTSLANSNVGFWSAVLFGEESSQETRDHVVAWASQCAQRQERLVIINSGEYMHFNCAPSFDDEELFITTD